MASPEFLQSALLYRQLSGMIQSQSAISDANQLKHLLSQAQASQVSFDKLDNQYYFSKTNELVKRENDEQK